MDEPEREESEFVKKLKALPQRERLIFFQIAMNGKSVEDVASSMDLSARQIEQIYEQVRRRLDLDVEP